MNRTCLPSSIWEKFTTVLLRPFYQEKKCWCGTMKNTHSTLESPALSLILVQLQPKVRYTKANQDTLRFCVHGTWQINEWFLFFVIGAQHQPEKSGTVLSQEKDSSSAEDMVASFPPTPPSSVPSPCSPSSPHSQQNSPAKAFSNERVSCVQKDVTSAFDFSVATVNRDRLPLSQSPPVSSPESIRSDTASPNCIEDGNTATAKQPILTNITELSLWKCGQCKKSFPQRAMLQVHVCNEAPQKPYQCGHCAQSFSHPAQLRAHAVIHASKKPFKCGYCSRAFAGATTLNNHIRTHTGEKPFVCDKCGKNFTQGSQLSRHQRIPGDCVARAWIKKGTERSPWAVKTLEMETYSAI